MAGDEDSLADPMGSYRWCQIEVELASSRNPLAPSILGYT
jgi:hypothetical protein